MIADSGASRHIVHTLGRYVQGTYFPHKESSAPRIRIGNGELLRAHGEGTICVMTTDSQGKRCPLVLTKVLFVPRMSCNLFSATEYTSSSSGPGEAKFVVGKGPSGSYLETPDGTTIPLVRSNGLLYIQAQPAKRSLAAQTASASTMALVSEVAELTRIHEALGHRNMKDLGQLFNISVSKFPGCVSCMSTKSTRSSLVLPQSLAGTATAPGMLWHTDIFGPMKIEGIVGQARYEHLFIDDFSAMMCIWSASAGEKATLNAFANVLFTPRPELDTLLLAGPIMLYSKEFKEYKVMKLNILWFKLFMELFLTTEYFLHNTSRPFKIPKFR
jgi:hypothetical protein